MLVLPKDFKNKLHNILAVMIPIFITQLAIVGMNFFDTVMSGNAGANDLAGVAMGANLWMPIFTGINGILLALVPIIAHLRGEENEQDLPKVVFNGIFLAIVIGLLVIISGYMFLPRIFDLLSLTLVVRSIAIDYLQAISLGIIPLFIATILRSFVDTMGFTRMTMRLFLLTLPVNVCLNYILIFGKFGAPRLGGVGAGYATAITCWLVLLAFIVLIKKFSILKNYKIFAWYVLSWKRIKEHLSIGIPMGTSIFFETSIFGVVAFFMAKFGTETIAAHQAALNFTSLLYMLPLSFSLALTILVGTEVGGKRYAEAVAYGRTGIISNWCIAMGFVALLVLFREYIGRLYGAEGYILALTEHFLFYAAFFQLLDATAAPIQGILRGYKDVKVPFYISLVAYWVICLPLGIFLDVYVGQGPYGYWQGLIIGILFSAGMLVLRLKKIQNKVQI
ncbi:MAG: MATE family efflux transporter [Acidaminococcaceae bacterium]|nr:MATE family efflux transporter [Acidaminococcaceae bacterium]